MEQATPQRRALVDRMAENCLEGIVRLTYDETLPLSEKNDALDSLVHTCLSSLPSLFLPLSKHPIAVRLFLAMLEEHYSENTGVPLSHDYSKIMNARSELATCIKSIATVLRASRLNIVRAPMKELDEQANIEITAKESARKGLTPAMLSAYGVKDIADEINNLVSNALKSIDVIDAELMIEEAVKELNILLNDRDVRRFVKAFLGEDPVECLTKKVRQYEEAKQADAHVSASASWVDRIYEDYQKCVEFSQNKPPCSEMRYLQDREVCARSKCATMLITLVPGILERLGVTTIVSQVVTK